MATFEIVLSFLQAIVLTQTPCPIISNDEYWMAEEACKVVIEAHEHKWTLAGAPVSTPSWCQMPCSPSV